MTQDWDPRIHTPSKIHPEGWALIIMLVLAAAFAAYLFAGLPA